jgi:hypothetical protein
MRTVVKWDGRRIAGAREVKLDANRYFMHPRRRYRLHVRAGASSAMKTSDPPVLNSVPAPSSICWDRFQPASVKRQMIGTFSKHWGANGPGVENLGSETSGSARPDG